MVAKINIIGEIGIDTSLKDVIRQFKSFQNPTSVFVNINSIGGSVEIGMDIYSYLRNLELPITTYTREAYSIAASIFMAGDTRIIEAIDNAMMIHLPSAEQVTGNAEYLDFVSKELRKIENDFADFYSKYTSIDRDSIKSLLKSETFLSGNEAVEMGFATEVKQPLKATAKFNKNIFKTENSKMTKTEKLIKAMTAFINQDVEIKALMVQDANGVEINFPDLGEEDTPKVEDTATIEDKPANGEYINKEGETWVFVEGVLTEIKPKEDAPEDEEDAPEDESLENLLASLEARLMAKLDERFKTQKTEKEALEAEIKAVRKLVGSEDIKIKAKETKTKTKQSTNYLR